MSPRQKKFSTPSLIWVVRLQGKPRSILVIQKENPSPLLHHCCSSPHRPTSATASTPHQQPVALPPPRRCQHRTPITHAASSSPSSPCCLLRRQPRPRQLCSRARLALPPPRQCLPPPSPCLALPSSSLHGGASPPPQLRGRIGPHGLIRRRGRNWQPLAKSVHCGQDLVVPQLEVQYATTKSGRAAHKAAWPDPTTTCHV